MKIANILFNYKKSTNENKILGVERCFIDYAKHLILNGNEVISVTKPNMVFSDEVKKTGSKFSELPALNQIDIFSIVRLAILLFNFKVDIAICHSGRAVFYARVARFLNRRKFPIVAIDHGVNPKKFIKADYIFAVNSYFSKKLIEAGKDADRALVIPNMIDPPKDFIKLEKKPFRKTIKLGSLGRLYQEKYFDKAIRAISILKERGIEAEYIIGGVGPQESNLKDLAKELGVEDNFKILGWVENKRDFFDAIDVFILPSECETFGIVLLEAMLYSTPIVTSNSWGPDEIIEEGVNGLKVSKDDAELMPHLLADAIQKLVNNEEMAKGLASKSYEKFFNNYSADMVGQKLNKMLLTIKNNEEN